MRRLFDADEVQERLDQRISLIAVGQHGVFARAQALESGATKDMIQHRVRTRRWDEVWRGVFVMAGTPRSWKRSLLTACLAWKQGAPISHRAGAELFRLPGFDARLVELTIPRQRKGRGPGIVHRSFLPPVDVTIIDSIPVTTPARTLIDLASVSSREAVEEAVDDAIRRGLVSIARLRWRMNDLARRGRPGISVMRSIIDAREGLSSVPMSVLETRFLRLLIRARIPPPEVQHAIREKGRVVAVVDFAWPDHRLAIEVDGFRWHSAKSRFEHDRARRNLLTLLGWRVVHVTWDDLMKRPNDVIAVVKRATS